MEGSGAKSSDGGAGASASGGGGATDDGEALRRFVAERGGLPLKKLVAAVKASAEPWARGLGSREVRAARQALLEATAAMAEGGAKEGDAQAAAAPALSRRQRTLLRAAMERLLGASRSERRNAVDTLLGAAAKLQLGSAEGALEREWAVLCERCAAAAAVATEGGDDDAGATPGGCRRTFQRGERPVAAPTWCMQLSCAYAHHHARRHHGGV